MSGFEWSAPESVNLTPAQRHALACEVVVKVDPSLALDDFECVTEPVRALVGERLFEEAAAVFLFAQVTPADGGLVRVEFFEADFGNDD